MKTFDIKKQGNSLFLVAIGASLWGTDAVLRLPLLSSLSSWQIVFLEHLTLALFSIPVFIIKWRSFSKLSLKEWLFLITISLGSSACATWLFTEAFRYGNPSSVVLLQKFQPLFALVLAQWLLKEKLSNYFSLAVLIALIGAYLLSFGFSAPYGNASFNQWKGSLLALGAAALWGAGTAFGRRVLGKLTFVELTSARFLLALPVLVVLQAVTPHHKSAFSIVLSQWGYVVALALIPGLIGLLLYYSGLRSTRASYATLAELAFPATSLLLNWVVLKQTISVMQGVGFLLVWAVVVVLSRDWPIRRAKKTVQL